MLLKPTDANVPAHPSARELFTSIDWSATPLGAAERWSPRLRSVVDFIFAGRVPMIVLWGPQLIHAAYNDAYAGLIGRRHPQAMGQANQATWPEVWHINGPIFESVLRSGREVFFEGALYPLERGGTREEVYMTISYGPVHDEDGHIGGVLTTMVETTRNVLAERRLRSLSALASRIARVRTVAEIGSIAADTLAENAGDVMFALVFADDAERANRAAGSLPELLGCSGLDEADARDLEAIALAVVGHGGTALIDLGQPVTGEAYPGRALGQNVREAYVAALPQGGASGPPGWIVVGVSPALPLDDRYREYLELVSAQLAVAFENALAFSREHRIADTLQHAALPGILPHLPGLAIDAVYEAGSDEAQIGGDWYDAFALRDGRVVISIGDVSGSGVVAAAAMGAARQMIRALTQTLDDPVDVLNAVDRALRVEDASPMITAFVGLLSADYERLSYASAGHPAPFVRRGDGRIDALWAPDLPIGLRDEGTGSGASTVLEKGSVVVLYTDGLTEATRDPVAGEARLKALLAKPGFVGSSRKAKYLYERLLDRRANDDVAILVIELLRDP